MNDQILPKPDKLHPHQVRIVYKNHRDEVAVRWIIPKDFYFGSNPSYYPEPQWLCHAMDIDKMTERTFAMNRIIHWEQFA